MPRATLSLACLWWLTLVGAVAAQSDLTSDTGVVSLQNYSGGVSYGGTYFQVQNVTGNGVGWTNGYTQLGVLTPYWMNEDTVFAANGRMIVTDNQQIGGNLGGFARHYSSGMDRLFGFNAFYDIDESINDFKYRQTGIGVETLGQWWDFRANGYFPVTSGDNFVRPLALTNNLSYVGHQIAFAGTGLYEQALTGGDFEFGRPIFAATPWLRGYAGMYMYNSKGVDPVGFRGRIEGWISDDLSVGVMVTEDRQFNTNVNAVVNFLFSGWKPTRWFPNFTTRERMLMPVQRNWRIAAGTYEQYLNIAAINPRTNQPYFVDWVDNSSTTAGPGDGTYENPFKTLQPNFPNADMILVNRGNTSAVAPLTGSIALTDYQRLLGEGTVHQFETFANFGGLSIPLQTRNLPGFTNSGNLPYVSGGAGNFVTLANNNEVSSFNILNSAGAGVTNTPAGSNNFDLNHLNLTNNAGGGIMLTQATSTGLIRNVNATNNLAGGISVDSGVIPLTLLMDTVTSNGQAPGAQAFGIRLLADDSAMVASLTNVTTNGNTGNGIDLRETNVGMQAVLTNVTSTGNGGDGLRADANGNGLALSLNTVKTTSNTGRGIYVTGNNAYISFNYSALDDNFNGNDNLNFTLTNNSTLVGGGLNNTHFDSSTNGSGIVFNTDSGSRIGSATNYFNLRDVTANGNNQSGMQIIATNASQQFINVVNGFFNNNSTLDGVTITENGGSGVVLNVDPTTLTGNGRDGLHFDVTGGSFLIGSFDQTQFNNNQNAGVYGIADSALVNLTFTASSMQNTVPFAAGAQDYGMQLNLSNMTQFAASITDGNITNNLQQGILLNLSGASPNDNSLALTNVQVNGNGLDGLKAAVQNTADLTISATSSSFSQNGLVGAGAGDGLDLSADTGSSLITSLTNSTVKQNSNQGILATANNTSLLGVLLDGTLVSQNSQNGISATANGGSGLGVITSNGTKIDDNALGGVIATANASGFLGEFTDTSISHNLAGRGVSFTGSGATPSEITFEDSFVYHNQLDNFFFDVSGGHQLSLSSTNTNFSLSNTGRGINGHVTGAGSYVEMDPFLNNIADGNKLDGMQLLVDTNAQLLGNINGGSYSLNGGDGVHVAVTTGGDAVICFDGTRMNANADDGYDFSVNDAGSSLYVLLQTSGTYGTLSGSYNGDQAYTFNMGAGTDGGVFTSGPNQFLFNRGATPISFTANGANSAAFSFSGTSNGNVGDGVSVQMSGVANAYIDIHDGEVSDNGGSGIDISLSSVTFSPTSLNILFPQSSTPFTVRGFNISNMIADANGEEGIKVIGTDVDMPAPGIMTVTGNTVTNSGQNVAADGILFNLSNDSVINGLVFDGNVADNNNGDGIALIAANSSFTTLTFTNGGMHENAGHGLNLDLTATPITNLNITNNVQGINEQVGLQFQITGNTLTDPYSIVNTSSSGIDVTGFVININPSGNEWDTDSSTGTPFAPVSPTQTTTGLFSVNGNTYPNSLPTGGVPDAQGILDLGFNSFNPGETFSWNIDADPIGGNDTVQGSELVGSTITVNFTGGLFLSGTLQPLGTDGSQFIATGGNISSPGASNNAGDGIHVSQAAGSNITNLNITGNQSNGNDGRGINLVSSDSTITTANVNTNNVTGNGSDGIQLDLTNTPITTLTLNGNTVATNLGEGIAIGTNSNITTLHVTNNVLTNNQNNGVYLNFNTSNVNLLDVTGNTITGSGSTSGATPSNFNIDVTFLGSSLTSAQQALVQAAVQRWEQIITGDLPNVGSVDDLDVTITVGNIDGSLNTLAQAGPTAVRPGTFLPYEAEMLIDSSDLAYMETNGIFQDVIEHELGHALGFGTIWTDLGLLTGAGGADPQFTGANATAQYNAIFSNTATSVPVENTGGPGTADAHWRESVFNNELMTGFANLGSNPISKVTVGQFQDLGYTVNYNAADAYTPSIIAPVAGVRLGQLNQPLTIANASQVSVAPNLTSLVAPSSSAGDGIHIEMTNSNIASTNFTTNTINLNQANGINYAVVDNSTVGPVVVLGN
ncbi:MAG: leishmanolysin-related zinc metalloendopeptidase [Planctomycetaceae bacterium]